MLKAYQSKKLILGEPMTSTKWLEIRSQYSNCSDASLEPDLEGYHVVYNASTPEEYHSWSPKLVFEQGHDELSSLNLTYHDKLTETANKVRRRIDAILEEDSSADLTALRDEIMSDFTATMTPSNPTVITSSKELIDRISTLSADDKSFVLSVLEDERVNLSSRAEHRLFAKILFALGTSNSPWVRSEFKLDTEAGFSTYTVGHYGWLKEIHATTNNHNLISFIKFVDSTISNVTK